MGESSQKAEKSHCKKGLVTIVCTKGVLEWSEVQYGKLPAAGQNHYTAKTKNEQSPWQKDTRAKDKLTCLGASTSEWVLFHVRTAYGILHKKLSVQAPTPFYKASPG